MLTLMHLPCKEWHHLKDFKDKLGQTNNHLHLLLHPSKKS